MILIYMRYYLCILQIVQFVNIDPLILCNNSEACLPSKDTYTNCCDLFPSLSDKVFYYIFTKCLSHSVVSNSLQTHGL